MARKLQVIGSLLSGEVDPEKVKEIVDNYLEENPPTSEGGGSIVATDDGDGNVVVDNTGIAASEEWITIADITTTEEVNKIWQDAPGFKRILMYVYLPSDLSVKSFYGFYTSDMWSSLYGFSFTGEGRKLLLDFEVIDDLGITLQLNINGNNSSVTNVNNGKLLREGTETELNGVGTALQNNGLFPVGTVIKIRGLNANSTTLPAAEGASY